MKDFLSIYDYLSYVLPGGVVLFAAGYGYFGPLASEPGVFYSLVLVVAAFVLGHACAALFNWIEPSLWGSRPFGKVVRTSGLFGKGGVYADAEAKLIASEFASRYPGGNFEVNYDLGYADLQLRGKDDFLQILNQQIGFYGHMACASIIAIVIVGVMWAAGKTYLPPAIWIPIFVIGAVLFAARYKHFWRRFGEQVVRSIRVLIKDSNETAATTSDA